VPPLVEALTPPPPPPPPLVPHPLVCRVTWPPESQLTDIQFIEPRQPKPKAPVLGVFLALAILTWLLASFISRLLFP